MVLMYIIQYTYEYARVYTKTQYSHLACSLTSLAKRSSIVLKLSTIFIGIVRQFRHLDFTFLKDRMTSKIRAPGIYGAHWCKQALTFIQ
jgi:hypothetical protein